MEETASAQKKALRINEDGTRFGTFAEIGAGQEVVRWFFKVGKAAATVAKSVSAYDMTVSDQIYGPADHYVSRSRLDAMLEHEYALLVKRLDEKRGATTRFFAFAETIATHSRPHRAGGHGWMGIRFQAAPRETPSEIVLHVQLLDAVTADEQDAIGKLGVNLIYAAFYGENPEKMIGGLMDDLTRARVEIDVVKCSGPAFANCDNRLVSLKLIEQGLTDVAMFAPDGEVVQAAEALARKPVLLERGTFRPVTNVTVEMIDRALRQMQRDEKIDSRDCLVLMEMTTHALGNGSAIDPHDFLARVDTLGALGKMVMITNYRRFHEVVEYLRNYTDGWLVMALGMPLLDLIFDEKFYTDLDGGILEAAGRLFKGRVKLYVYPMKETAGGGVSGVESLQVPAKLRHLAEYLVDNEFIEPIEDAKTTQLHLSTRDVLAKIEQGDANWEQMVPPAVVEMIKARGLFGYRSM